MRSLPSLARGSLHIGAAVVFLLTLAGVATAKEYPEPFVSDVEAKCSEVTAKLASSEAPALVTDNWDATVDRGGKVTGTSERWAEETAPMVWPRVIVELVDVGALQGTLLWGQDGDSYWGVWTADNKPDCWLMEGTAELLQDKAGKASLRIVSPEKRVFELDDGSGVKTTIVYELRKKQEGQEKPGDLTAGHTCKTSKQCRYRCKVVQNFSAGPPVQKQKAFCTCKDRTKTADCPASG